MWIGYPDSKSFFVIIVHKNASILVHLYDIVNIDLYLKLISHDRHTCQDIYNPYKSKEVNLLFPLHTLKG